MATQTQTRLLGNDVTLGFDRPWMGYWMAFLRLVTGWWMLHAGLDKLLHMPFDAGGWLTGATQGTLVAPITVWAGETGAMLAFANLAIPIGELLIGLGLLLGALTRLAAFFGAFLMFFFYFGNAGFDHGMVNGDLMGLLLFGTVLVAGAGRIWGLDEYLEETTLVQNNPWLKYLLG